jgi:serine/threonine protein phosphatase PrpC
VFSSFVPTAGDYDRVEQCWETEILPILDGKLDLDSAGLRLVEIANTQNGHDNVTIGIVYCQVSASKPEPAGASQDLQITVPPSDSLISP